MKVLCGLLLVAPISESVGESPTTQVVTVGGETYSNVTWGAITPVTVTLHHSTGVASIPLEKLPAELQDQFGYDPEKAVAFLQKQADYRAAQQLAREATSKAIDSIINLFGFSSRYYPSWPRVETTRERYRRLIELRPSAAPEYLAAIDSLANACRRAIELHLTYRETPRDPAAASYPNKNFRPDSRRAGEIAFAQRLFAVKIAEDAMRERRDKLKLEASRYWEQGLQRKTEADKKWKAQPPPQPAKPQSSDLYLKEIP